MANKNDGIIPPFSLILLHALSLRWGFSFFPDGLQKIPGHEDRRDDRQPVGDRLGKEDAVFMEQPRQNDQQRHIDQSLPA